MQQNCYGKFFGPPFISLPPSPSPSFKSKDDSASVNVLGGRQKLLGGFFSVKGVGGGGTPPTPLTENHFAKKPLAEMGGTAPPP